VHPVGARTASLSSGDLLRLVRRCKPPRLNSRVRPHATSGRLIARSRRGIAPSLRHAMGLRTSRPAWSCSRSPCVDTAQWVHGLTPQRPRRLWLAMLASSRGSCSGSFAAKAAAPVRSRMSGPLPAPRSTGMLASMRQGETGGTVRRAVYDLRDHGERLDRARQQPAADEDVARSHFVVGVSSSSAKSAGARSAAAANVPCSACNLGSTIH
jgi:hypothetical protein